MASVLPTTRIDKVVFCENHVALWNTNAVAIGTTTTAVTDLTSKTTSARAAYNAHVLAQDNAKNATEAYYQAVATMAGAASDIIKQVKTKAAISGDGIYTLANIPVPAAPSPKAPPGPITDFKVTLNGNGALELTWKCANPPGTSGTIYQVWRQIGESGTMTYLGGSGTKDFTDDTLPAGSVNVEYQIQGVRSTAVGPWGNFNVKFGVSSGGMTMVRSVTEGPTKMAA